MDKRVSRAVMIRELKAQAKIDFLNHKMRVREYSRRLKALCDGTLRREYESFLENGEINKEL